jgi:hypothetical protein
VSVYQAPWTVLIGMQTRWAWMKTLIEF